MTSRGLSRGSVPIRQMFTVTEHDRRPHDRPGCRLTSQYSDSQTSPADQVERCKEFVAPPASSHARKKRCSVRMSLPPRVARVASRVSTAAGRATYKLSRKHHVPSADNDDDDVAKVRPVASEFLRACARRGCWLIQFIRKE